MYHNEFDLVQVMWIFKDKKPLQKSNCFPFSVNTTPDPQLNPNQPSVLCGHRFKLCLTHSSSSSSKLPTLPWYFPLRLKQWHGSLCVFFFYSHSSGGVWKAHQCHPIGCRWFNNILEKYQYLLEVKPWTVNPSTNTHISFEVLKTAWFCEAVGNEIDMPGLGPSLSEKPSMILFFFSLLYFSSQKSSLYMLSNDKKKISRAGGNRGGPEGKCNDVS